MTVHLPICKHQRESHWTDCSEIWCWGLSWNRVQKLQIWSKSDKKSGYFCRRHKSATKALLCNTQHFCIADSDMQLSIDYALLRFNSNNGHANAPLCYVTWTLPILFSQEYIGFSVLITRRKSDRRDWGRPQKKLQDSWCPESRFEQGTSITQDYSVTARLIHMFNQ
jgi:hypothetical protein